MEIELVEVTHAHAPVLAALLELYQYDFTEFTDEDVGEDGRFGASDLVDRYSGGDELRRGFLLKIGGNWAGLTLLHRGAFLVDDAEMMDIVEFFVMRKYRRHGAGEAMAPRSGTGFRGAGRCGRSPATFRRRRFGGRSLDATLERGSRSACATMRSGVGRCNSSTAATAGV